MREGFRPWGPPNSIKKYEKFYMAACVEKIRWVRPIFEGVLAAMKEATRKPFKIGCFGPGQTSVIVSDRYYNDNVALAMDLSAALNDEFKYLRSLGLGAIQIIDVLPPYTHDMWQIHAANSMLGGLDTILWSWRF